MKRRQYNEKETSVSADLLRAVGETRTRTGLLPLPPQSSVSTISPPPLLLFWDCKGTTNILICKFFCIFFVKFSKKRFSRHFVPQNDSKRILNDSRMFNDRKGTLKTAKRALINRSFDYTELFIIFARFSSGRKARYYYLHY